MHYRLTLPQEPHAAAIMETALEALRQDKHMQHDRVRLNRACCGSNSLVQLLGAPIPAKVAASLI